MKIFLGIALLFFVVGTSVQSQEITFEEGSWEEMLDLAKKKKKPFFVDFSTVWCGYCKKMDRNTFADSSVAAYVDKNYLAYKIDAEKGEGPKLATQYGVKGYPTIAYFNPKGELLGIRSGYYDARSFLLILQQYKLQVKSAPEKDVSSYISKKKPLIDAIEREVNADKSTKQKEYEMQARNYGAENNHFDFGELKYKIGDKQKALLTHVEAQFELGRNKQDVYNSKMLELLFMSEVSAKEKHFILLSALESESVDLETLKAVNQLVLSEKKVSYDLLDTKAAIQYMYGDVEDAEETAKEALKLAKKEGRTTETTDALLELIKQ